MMLHLHFDPATPRLARTVAEAALVLHMGAGGLGLLSGAVAAAAPKGRPLHRLSGNVFGVSMLTMATMAVYVAVLLGQWGNVAGGVLTIYLVATGWRAARRDGAVGVFDYGALGFAVATTGLLLGFALQALTSRTGVFGGDAPPLYFIFAALAALSGGLDLRVILRRGLHGVHRIRRHLWRLCVGLFFATGSFFLGQQKVLPAVLQGSPLLFVLAFAPLAAMVVWLVRVRRPSRRALRPPRPSVLMTILEDSARS